MSSEFTNTGCREGIIAGKEAPLQEGFDAGFAQVGVPTGHKLGLRSGMASARTGEARGISSALSSIRLSDIDIEAEEHLEDDMVTRPERIDEKRKIEDLEDTLNGLSTAKIIKADERRPTLEVFQQLKRCLKNLVERLDCGQKPTSLLRPLYQMATSQEPRTAWDTYYSRGCGDWLSEANRQALKLDISRAIPNEE
ncbi:hypothetical protein F5146DRAFT_1006135 [Armillaria mellea]|nr:hypothetical protein F5146DRAFT_1006135 [Armillaria mellea]